MRAARGIVFACAVLGVAAFAAAALVTLADILGRQAGFAVPGVVDLVQLFVLAGAWLSIPYAFLERAHVSVDLLTERMAPRVRRLLEGTGGLVGVLVLAPATWRAYESALLQMRFGDRSQQLGIPMIWYWSPLVLGMALSALVAGAMAVAAFRDVAATGRTP